MAYNARYTILPDHNRNLFPNPYLDHYRRVTKMKRSTKKNLKAISKKLQPLDGVGATTRVWSDFAQSLESDGNYAKDSNYAREQADKFGWVINYGTSTLLLVDVDTKDGLLKTHQCLHVFRKSLHSKSFKDLRWTQSKSGKGYHIYVHLEEDDAIEDIEKRITTQALLGSDPLREILGIKIRIENYDPTPTLFFELPNTIHHPYDILYSEVIRPMEEKWEANQRKRSMVKIGKPRKKQIRKGPIKNDCGDGSTSNCSDLL